MLKYPISALYKPPHGALQETHGLALSVLCATHNTAFV
jgi:hypothetical protein